MSEVEKVWVLHLGFCKPGIVQAKRVRGWWKWRRTEKFVAFSFGSGIQQHWKPLSALLTDEQREGLIR